MSLSQAFPHLKSIFFLDEPQRIEAMMRGGILTYPCQMEFCSEPKSDALKRMTRSPPDLLVSSLAIRDGTAFDLVNELKLNLGSIPAIFIAEPSQLEMQNELLKLGAFDVIERPFTIPDLIKKIDRAVRASGAAQHKTRIEGFLEYAKLQEESVSRGILVADLIDLKKSNSDGTGS